MLNNRKAFMLVVLVCFLVLAACDKNNANEHTSGTISEGNGGAPAYTVIAKDLKIPWSIAFDNGDIYMSEREGSIVKVDATGKLTRESVKLHKPLHVEGEGGLLGVVLTPDFKSSSKAFAYHTYKENDQVLNRIVVLKQTKGGWVEDKSLLEGIPGYQYHNGGRLAIGPDGKLYATTGDSGVEERAQQLDSLAGKILRLNLDGSVPADNPFPDSYVYSYGHRNPQGIAWNAQGVMYSTEHGPSGDPGGHDEINLIVPGGNYGWPDIIGDEKKEGMISPIYQTGETALAPSGMAIDDEGRIWFAALRGEGLYRFDPATGKIDKVLDGVGRLRDVQIHNGKMYVITNNTDGRGTPGKDDDRLLLLG
ncbi:PQQ-dependent sugar dehydrogenase [Paenibacillus sp. NPDC058071]|uniref:PQQ-dependent sugar dehydrogenase n=1 Tax=Paenibacillus sp. NPDC058071 TaxID=3346326 RepID=UPI0036DED5D4